MVQVINMQERPSMGAAFGQGFASGVSTGLQEKMQEMQDIKKQQRINENNADINAQYIETIGENNLKKLGLEGLLKHRIYDDPKNLLALLEHSYSRSQMGDMSDAVLNSPLNRGNQRTERGQPAMSNQADPAQKYQPMQLPMGQAPMLPYEDIPAELAYEDIPATEDYVEPIVSPRESSSSEQQVGKATPYEKLKADTEEYWNEQIRKSSAENQGKAIQNKERELNRLAKDREIEQKNEKIELQKKESEYREHKDVIDRNEKVSEPYLKNVFTKEKQSAGQGAAFQSAENAIRSGNTEGLIPFIAQKFNWLPGQNPDSAILNASAKEFLFNNVARSGARPNMWLEQQVRSMFPQVGQSQEAALSVLEMIKNDSDVSREEARIARDLQDKYKAEGLDYVPKEIEQEVNERLIPYINDKKNQLAFKLKQIQEEKYSDSDLDKMIGKKVRQGTPLTERMGLAILRAAKGNTKKAMNFAKNRGYMIPGEE